MTLIDLDDYNAPKKLPDTGELVALLQDGHTTEELSDLYGVTTSRIRTVVNASGYNIKGKPLAPRAAFHCERSPFAVAGDWIDQALCAQADPEEWFPDKGGSTLTAKAICARCPVAAECLDYALANNERFGIWGGASERERHALLPKHTCERCQKPLTDWRTGQRYCPECRAIRRRETKHDYDRKKTS